MKKFIKKIIILSTIAMTSLISPLSFVTAQESTLSAEITTPVVSPAPTTAEPTAIIPSPTQPIPTTTADSSPNPTSQSEPSPSQNPLPTVSVIEPTSTQSAGLSTTPKKRGIADSLPSISPNRRDLRDSARLKRKTKLKDFRRKSFQANERVTVDVEKDSENNINLTLINPNGAELPVLYNKSESAEVVTYGITPPQSFVPGTYQLKITDSSGTTITQDFTWGVLAINTNKSIYLPNETARLMMGVLDEKGKMVCDATLRLEIKNPAGEIKMLSTENGGVKIGPDCKLKAYTPNPDFEANYTVGSVGVYNLTLTATTKNGTYTINDLFEVRESVPFDVERSGPTRIYPPVTYPVELKITANQDFFGVVEEVVPIDFTISPNDETPYENEEKARLQDAGMVLGASTFHLELPFEGKPTITTNFGEEYDDRSLTEKIFSFGLHGHDGVDFALPEGSPIFAADGGTVVHAGNNPYGQTVIIEHPWGQTYYGHLSEITVKKGDSVQKKQPIAKSGNTGLSTGPHLHFAVKPKDSDPQNGYHGMANPANYLNIETSVLGAQTEYRPDVRILKWNVNLKKGETKTLKYSFKAPRQSPAFYMLGQLRFVDKNAPHVAQTTPAATSTPSPTTTTPFPSVITPTPAENIGPIATDEAVLGVATSEAQLEATPSAQVAVEVVAPATTSANLENNKNTIIKTTNLQPQSHDIIFQEVRRWQIAVDDTVTVVSDRQLSISTATNSWTNKASITLTTNGSWLVMTTFDFGVDNVTTNGEVRLQQDNTTDLQYGRYEDMIATESYKNWFWMTRVERSGSNITLDLDFESMGAGVTARIRNAIIVAIRLDDLGTEDTDWRWGSNNTTFSNLNSTFEDSDGVILTETWTPASEEAWIIMANTEYTANSTSVNAEVRLSRNDEAATYDYAEHEGEDTAEWLWWSSLRQLTLPTSEQKFEIQVRGDSGTVVDAQRPRFFAVKESVFDQVSGFRADSFTGPTSADNWEEKLNASFTPNQTEDVLILGHAGIAFGATARIGRTRIHEAETTAVMNNDDSSADAQSIWTTAIADVINMSAAYNADMDINASNTAVTFGDAGIVFVSLTLASSGINISGSCDQYDQSTDCSDDGTGHQIKVAYDGVAQSTVDETVDGSWQITGITAPTSGQVVTVYINGESTASERAVAVTKYDGSGDITGVKLFQRHLVIGSDDNPTVSNTNLSQYDNGVSGDSDIFFEVDSNDDLTVDTSAAYTDEKLYVLSGTTYQPGTGNSSNISTHDFQNIGTTDITANSFTVNGSWTNSGTFSDTCSGTTTGTNASLVTFTSTSTGETLSGTLNGSSDFCKVNFNGSGGGWTIQSPMLVSSANATDTFVVTAGTVTLGNGGGDHLDVRGAFTIASSSTFQSMTGLAQGDTTACNSDDICIEINANSSPPSCSNCTIANSGTFDIDKNVTVRFNSNAATESGIDNSSSGYLEIQGTQDDTGTDTGTSATSTRETQICASESWTNDQHNNKYVRMTDGLARGRIYLITDTLDQDADSNCATGTHDAITFDDTSTATDASPTVSCSGNKCVITSSVETLITADNDHIGRYIHDVTGTEGYYLIIDSTESGSDTITVIGDPSTLALATNDDIEVTDGIRSGDSFEILDYAEVTANTTYNGYIHNASGSEMIMRYAKVAEMGAETSNKYGINGASINGANASEGFLVEKSYITNSHRSIRCDGCSHLTEGNTSGVINNYIYNASQEGVDFSNNNNEVIGNRIDTVGGNGEGIIMYASSNSVIKNNIVTNADESISVIIGNGVHVISGNKVYDGTYGIYVNDSEEVIAVDNDIFSTSSQGIYAPTTENLYLGSNRVDVGTVHFDTSNSSATNVTAAEELYGYYSGASTADVRYQSTGAHKARFYNSYFGSTTEVSGATTANAFLASFKHDQTSGATKIWNDYVVPNSNDETPQSEQIEKYNYANNLYEDSATPHFYSGTGTEDSDIDITLNSALSTVEVYRATVTTANGDNPTFTVTRSGGTASPTTCAFSGGTCTYTEGTTGVQFTLTDGATNHVAGDTYTFMVFPDANDTSTQKNLTMMQDADTYTVGSGEKVELKGQTTDTNVTQVDAGAGGYSFIIQSGGTIDASSYAFDEMGGTSQTIGLDLQSGATVTSLNDGDFDNFTTDGTDTTYVKVASGIIDSGSQTWTEMAFNDTTSYADYNVTLNGTPSACSTQWTFQSEGTMGGDTAGEANDNDVDANCSGLGYLLWDDIPTGPTNDQLMRHGAWFSNGVEQPFTF